MAISRTTAGLHDIWCIAYLSTVLCAVAALCCLLCWWVFVHLFWYVSMCVALRYYNLQTGFGIDILHNETEDVIYTLLAWLTSAPALISAFTTSRCPLKLAMYNGVRSSCNTNVIIIHITRWLDKWRGCWNILHIWHLGTKGGKIWWLIKMMGGREGNEERGTETNGNSKWHKIVIRFLPKAARSLRH